MLTENTLTLRNLFYIFFKNKYKILIVFVTAMAISAAYCFLTFPVYRSEVKVLVKMGKEKFSSLDDYYKENYNVLFQERNQNINNEIEILKGNLLNEQLFFELKDKLGSIRETKKMSHMERLRVFVADTLEGIKDFALKPFYLVGLVKKQSDDQKFIARLNSSLRVEALEDTDVIKIGFDWDDPDFSAFVVNKVAHEYMLRHIKAYQSEKSQGFYSDQIKLITKKLNNIDKALDKFLKKGNISNIALQKELLLKDLSELEKKYQKSLLSYNEASLRVKEVKGMHEAPETWIETLNVGSDTSYLKKLDDNYFELAEKRNRMLASFKPDSTEIKRIEGLMKDLRDQKAESLINILEGELTTLEYNNTFYENAIREKKHMLDTLNKSTFSLARLEAEREILKNNLALYKEKGEDLRISNAMNNMQITSTTIIQEGIPPTESVWPKKKLLLLISGILGIFIGTAYSLISEFFDNTIKRKEDLAEIGLQHLATIPHSRHSNRLKR